MNNHSVLRGLVPGLLILLVLLACKHEQQTNTQLPHFKGLTGKCNELSDINGEMLHPITTEDSLAAEVYFPYFQQLYKTQGKSIMGVPLHIYYENVIASDSGRIHKLIRNINRLEKKGVDYESIRICLQNSMIFKGRVVHIDDYSDSCLQFRTSYKIEVLEVFWSDFELAPKETLNVVSAFSGYLGGCTQDPEKKKTMKVALHVDIPKINDVDYFVVDRSHYERILAINERQDIFDDPYCPSAYAFSNYSKESRVLAAHQSHIINSIFE